MKRIQSPKQWASALLLFVFFSAATFCGYIHFNADARFESFTEEFFLEEIRSNPIHFHYSIDNPDAFHIDETALRMPVYRAGDAANDISALSLVKTQLESFDNAKLSNNNRYLHTLLSSYIDAVGHTSAYPFFSEPLSPSSGAPSQLPILLAEYRLDTAQDVECYLAILEQIPDYFDGLIVYEREKAEAGLFMADSTADKVIRQCAALMDRGQLEDGSHFLEITFAQRLQTLVSKGIITQSAADSYQSENNRLLTTVAAPAYDALADELTLLKGSGKELCGLAHQPGGREYYKALLRLRTGSCRDITQIKQMLYDDLAANYAALGRLLADNDTLRDTLLSGASLLPELSPEEILAHLANAVRQTYPAIPADREDAPIACTVKYVDASLEPYSAPAFYMTPPVDNVLNNTIYINAADTPDDLSLFTTLAHEGYPGHLYQTVYSQRFWAASDMTPLRSILYYGGYVEGWAMYAEMSSYDYAIALAKDAHPDAAAYYLACRLDRQIQLCLYALLDIAIHHDGASLDDVYEIFASLGSADRNTVAAVYAYIVEEPCNYPKYYLGYLEVMALKKQAAAVFCKNTQNSSARNDNINSGEAASDADYIYEDPAFLNFFHRFLLEKGPADFGTLSRLLASVSP